MMSRTRAFLTASLLVGPLLALPVAGHAEEHGHEGHGWHGEAHRGGGGYRRGGGGFGPGAAVAAGILGLGLGAVVAGAVAPPPVYYAAPPYYYPPPPPPGYAPPPGYGYPAY